MLDDWFRVLRFKITFDEFERLPRHPAYKQEYYDDQCVLTPRPKGYHAMMKLADFAPPDGPPPIGSSFKAVQVRRLRDEDWGDLPDLFAGAFHRTVPFDSLDDDERVEAARDCLAHTRSSGDGPLIGAASGVAIGAEGRLVGALLVTLWPDRDLTEARAARWPAPPPSDAVDRRLGLPHVTWVFVHPLDAGRGIGTAMLAHTVRALRELGYGQLGTSFVTGNASSMLWHWRNGFRLLESPWSMRKIDGEIRAARSSRAAAGGTT